MNQPWPPSNGDASDQQLWVSRFLLQELQELEPDKRKLAALMQLVQLLQETLTPMAPDAGFRARLHASLLEEANSRHVQPARRWNRVTRHWKLTAAAAASGVSVAVGVITVVALARARTHPTQVGPLG